MPKECAVCHEILRLSIANIHIADGVVCPECWAKTGLGISSIDRYKGKEIQSQEFNRMARILMSNKTLLENYSPTLTIGKQIMFDDKTKTFVVTVKKIKNSEELFLYENIVSFEMIDERTSKLELASTSFGLLGYLFGKAVGKHMAKTICKSLKIKITLKNTYRQEVYAGIIWAPTGINTAAYDNAFKEAQKCLSALQSARDNGVSRKNGFVLAPSHSSKEEITKLKNAFEKLNYTYGEQTTQEGKN